MILVPDLKYRWHSLPDEILGCFAVDLHSDAGPLKIYSLKLG
jgi:hypothetical protein